MLCIVPNRPANLFLIGLSNMRGCNVDFGIFGVATGRLEAATCGSILLVEGSRCLNRWCLPSILRFGALSWCGHVCWSCCWPPWGRLRVVCIFGQKTFLRILYAPEAAIDCCRLSATAFGCKPMNLLAVMQQCTYVCVCVPECACA